MVLKKSRTITNEGEAILDSIMRQNEAPEMKIGIIKPTKEEVNEIFNKPRATKWENMTVDFNNSMFDVPAQQARLKQFITPTVRENFYKSKFPESEEIPTGRLDYKDNAFEKIYQQNLKSKQMNLKTFSTPQQEWDRTDIFTQRTALKHWENKLRDKKTELLYNTLEYRPDLYGEDYMKELKRKHIVEDIQKAEQWIPLLKKRISDTELRL